MNTRIKNILLFSILLVHLLFPVTGIWAAEMLDQSFVPSGTQGSFVSEPERIHAQTFTVGLAGQLTSVDLFVHIFASSGAGDLPEEPLIFNLLGTDPDGIPDITQILATVSLTSSQLPTTFNSSISIDLKPFNIFVSVDETLALTLQCDQIRLSGVTSPGYVWGISGGNPYPGGNLFISPNFGANFYATGATPGVADVGFRTFVTVDESHGDDPAEIISIDDPILGIGKITRDTQAGLDWLDLDLTANLSWNEAETTYASQRFRHATLSEVENLFTNAGIPEIGTGSSATNYLPAHALQSLITCLPGFNSTTNSDTCGSFAWTAIVDGFSELSWIDRNDTVLEATVIVNSNNITGSNPDVFDTFAHPARSHWMVRTVEPDDDSGPRANVLLYVDNTANWSRNAGGQAIFVNEKNALVNVVNNMTDQFNLGLMMFPETGGDNDSVDGGYIRFGIRQMTATNKSVLAADVGGLSELGDKGNNNTLSEGMVEAFRYFSGGNSKASHGKVKSDYDGNTNNQAFINALGDYPLPTSPSAASNYVSPIVHSCQKNFLIYISNGPSNENNSSLTVAETELAVQGYDTSSTISLTPNGQEGSWMDEWAKYLANADINGEAAGEPVVYTYVVEVDPGTSGQGLDMTALMKSVALHGKGKYFAVSSTNNGQDIVNALNQIFNDSEGDACDLDTDSDGDGTGNNTDTDDDNDGVADGSDNCPLDINPGQENFDGDGQGDVCDLDDDNDGTDDTEDVFPFDPTETLDTDSDGTGNNADTDDDNDGIPDTYEHGVAFLDPLNAADALLDQDADGYSNLREYLARTDPLDASSFPSVSYWLDLLL